MNMIDRADIAGGFRGRCAGMFGGAVVLALSLGACGGDSGGASGPPALALSADTSTTAAGGASVALHATVTNSSDAPSWSLSGPGTLSATSGPSVSYVPPDVETSPDAATATVTVTAAGLTQQTQIALTAVAVAGHHWTVATPASSLWQSTAYGGGVFVAIGTDGGIATSADGVTWTRHDTPHREFWQSVAFGDHGWVAVGIYGELATSPDGTTWTESATPLIPPAMFHSTFIREVAAGNGAYVVVGSDKSFVSADGDNWTTVGSGFGSIAFGNGLFVATALDGIHTSPDGIAWAATGFDGAAGEGQAGVPFTIAFGNGEFLATDEFANNYSSTDGLAWVTQAVQSTSIDVDSQDVFAAGAFHVMNGALYSTDGTASWSQVAAPAMSYVGVAASPTAFVAVGRDGAIASGADAKHLAITTAPSLQTFLAIDRADGLYIATSLEGLITTSSDGMHWTTTNLTTADGASFGGDAIAHAPDGTIVVAGFTIGPLPFSREPVPAYAWSPDGVRWSVIAGGGFSHFTAVIHDGTRFVAVDGEGGVDTSTNGRDWTSLATLATSDGGVPLSALAVGGGRTVAVGLYGVAAVSSDGATLATAPTVVGGAGTGLNFGGVAFAAGRFVAVADDGEVASSSDGLTWQVTPSATTQALRAITVTPQGVLVAVGDGGVIETSVDGVHWTLRTAPASQGFYAVTVTADGVMAVGEDNLVEVSTN